MMKALVGNSEEAIAAIFPNADVARLLTRITCNPGLITGGEGGTNIVAEECTVALDMRLPWGGCTPEAVLAKVEQDICAPGVCIESCAAPTCTSPECDWYVACRLRLKGCMVCRPTRFCSGRRVTHGFCGRQASGRRSTARARSICYTHRTSGSPWISWSGRWKCMRR
ncbi:peptidase dimerization domain-containing protein [Methanogenium cariaci]|uniref:peptidase dimerization domain-containing protein n=1 Tax=Methanogenium cariaci TaxID=2197 RepID=UPI000786137E|nr:peptidase dimerization domain-containing protein [Methanogenium cariaci]